ncbi:MAG TPA: GNAT family N-acetyltransferase [Gaiellaceae bacterium]|jgi:CelD/BcsL family acetyltransferase involved in cellulose biosynthesis|nr:GNAT family N-acetyltransferase [Gaiellaceae bacterium]
MVTTEVISSEADLEALGGDWDDLVRSMPRPSPFLLRDWLVEWWRHYGDGGRLTVHVARRDGRLIGALPLCRRRRYGLAVTEFVGGSRTPLADLLLAPGENGDTAAGLVGEAMEDDHDFADLFGMSQRSRLVKSLPTGALRLVERLEAPVLDLSKGWEEIERTRLSSKARATRRQRLKKLSKLGPVEITVARTADELEPALDEAFRLHALRWAGHRETSGFSSPTGRAFHRAAVARLAPTGVPRLVLIRVGEQAVAYNLYLQLDRMFCGVTMAFDPEYAKYAPGTEALLSTLETAAAEGVERAEFLGAATDYKQRLADGVDPIYEGLGLAANLRGRAAVNAIVNGIRLRRRLKRSPTAQRIYDRVPRLGRAA